MEGADPQLVAELNEAFTRLAIPDAGGVRLRAAAPEVVYLGDRTR